MRAPRSQIAAIVVQRGRPCAAAGQGAAGVRAPHGDEHGPEAFIGHQRALLDRLASRQGLATNCVPMLVPVGSKDHLTPVGDWQEIAAGIAGSKLMDVPGCGDLWTLQAPDLVTAALPAWTEA